MSDETRLNRRGFLRLAGTLVGSVVGATLLGACQPKVVEVEKVVTQVVKETVVVEVEGEKQVVEVEKEVTRVVQQAAPKAQELSFWMWNTYAPPADNVMELGLLHWAEANNVKIKISRDSDGKVRDKVMPALEAGTLPDAMFIGASDGILMHNAKGLVPLNDLFAEIGNEHGGWMPNLDVYSNRDGEMPFIPYSIDTPMVHYRMDVFENAGITVPEGQWTWQETMDLCMQAQDWTESQGDTKIGWGFGAVKQQHDGWCGDLFRNLGADVWDASGQKIILADEKSQEATDALNFAKQGWDMGLFPSDAASWDWSSNNKSFQEEQCILCINSASIYTWAKSNKPDLEKVTGLAPKPSALRETTNASLRYTTVLPSVSKNKELATELIRALYTADIYVPWLEQGFVTNVLHEYDTLDMWEGTRGAFNLAANIGVYPGYPAPYDNAAMAEAGGPNDPVGSMIVRVLVDGWEPARAIEEADKFAKSVFAKHFK